MPKKKKKEELSFEQQLAAHSGGQILEDVGKCRYFVDTGNLALNYCTSGKFIGGGFPGGKITEVYGPPASSKSLLGYTVAGAVQRQGGYSIVLDCERAINPDFAMAAGHCDPSKIVVVHPFFIEECEAKIFNMIRFIREHKGDDVPIFFVWDSIGVAPCKREWSETELPEEYSQADFKRIVGANQQPGERAKRAGEMLRKVTPFLDEYNTTMFIVNQIREKIGVLFGCFSGRSKVMLADGSWMKISKIVNQKLDVKVMSLNCETGKVEPKRVIDWHKNGVIEEGKEKFLKVRFKREFQNCRGTMTVTPNHTVFVVRDEEVQEVGASELKVGDKLATLRSEYFGYQQWQVAYGSILGDGSVRHTGNGSSLRFGHGKKQRDYLKFKRSFFGELAGNVFYKGDGRSYCDIKSVPEISHLSEYRKDYCIPQEIADSLDEFGLAIWYMDDGTYSGYYKNWGNGKCVIYAKKWQNREIMLPVFKKMGLDCKITKLGYVFDSENTLKLHRIISRFVPPSMQYKLHPRCRGLFDVDESKIELPQLRWERSKGEVISIEDFDHTVFPGDRCKFDLTIEDNATYVVGGAIVHNSPETTAGGGNALPFYASTRVRTGAAKSIKDTKKKIPIGVSLKFTNKKNRSFTPFLSCENIPLYFNQGIDPLGGLLEALINAGRVEKVSNGNYKVLPEYAGGTEYSFKASATRGDVDEAVLKSCPAVVDAKDDAEITAYLKPFKAAMDLRNDPDLMEENLDDEAEDLAAKFSEIA